MWGLSVVVLIFLLLTICGLSTNPPPAMYTPYIVPPPGEVINIKTQETSLIRLLGDVEVQGFSDAYVSVSLCDHGSLGWDCKSDTGQLSKGGVSTFRIEKSAIIYDGLRIALQYGNQLLQVTELTNINTLCYLSDSQPRVDRIEDEWLDSSTVRIRAYISSPGSVGKTLISVCSDIRNCYYYVLRSYDFSSEKVTPCSRLKVEIGPIKFLKGGEYLIYVFHVSNSGSANASKLIRVYVSTHVPTVTTPTSTSTPTSTTYPVVIYVTYPDGNPVSNPNICFYGTCTTIINGGTLYLPKGRHVVRVYDEKVVNFDLNEVVIRFQGERVVEVPDMRQIHITLTAERCVYLARIVINNDRVSPASRVSGYAKFIIAGCEQGLPYIALYDWNGNVIHNADWHIVRQSGYLYGHVYFQVDVPDTPFTSSYCITLNYAFGRTPAPNEGVATRSCFTLETSRNDVAVRTPTTSQPIYTTTQRVIHETEASNVSQSSDQYLWVGLIVLILMLVMGIFIGMAIGKRGKDIQRNVTNYPHSALIDMSLHRLIP